MTKDIYQLAQELAANIKTEKDLNEFSAVLKKLTIESALNAELREHSGFDKNERSLSTNKRNGSSKKMLKSPDGTLELEIPKDREGSFSPQLIKKHQTRITSMDEQILALYSRGMSNQEIVQFFKEMYDADVSASLISRVTELVICKSILYFRCFGYCLV